MTLHVSVPRRQDLGSGPLVMWATSQEGHWTCTDVVPSPDSDVGLEKLGPGDGDSALEVPDRPTSQLSVLSVVRPCKASAPSPGSEPRRQGVLVQGSRPQSGCHGRIS